MVDAPLHPTSGRTPTDTPAQRLPLLTHHFRLSISAMEKSRQEVIKCEKEIDEIKRGLKSLSSGSAIQPTNQLKISILKKSQDTANEETDGEPETYKVLLSSPIEERVLTKLHDPLDVNADGSVAEFDGIESSNALLTIEVYSGGKKLGTSADHDLQPICKELAHGEKTTVEFAIVGEKSGLEEEAVVEEKDEEAVEENNDTTALADGKSEGEDKGEVFHSTVSRSDSDVEEFQDAVEDDKEGNVEADVEAEASGAKLDEPEPATPPQDIIQLPICTLSVQLEYTPSLDDERDALYERLNEVSKRKVAAIESLRKHATAVSRARAAAEAGTVTASDKDRAVKAGFLNKAKITTVPPPFWKRWYEKTIGPKSMLWIVGPIAKNYIMFIGVSVLIHYKGDLLALPPPV